MKFSVLRVTSIVVIPHHVHELPPTMFKVLLITLQSEGLVMGGIIFVIKMINIDLQVFKLKLSVSKVTHFNTGFTEFFLKFKLELGLKNFFSIQNESLFPYIQYMH